MPFSMMPVRNPDKFDKIIFLKKGGKGWLFIPHSLRPISLSQEDNWLNPTQILFHPLEDYLLITDSTSLKNGHDSGAESQQHLFESRQILFPIVTQFGKMLSPHFYEKVKELSDPCLVNDAISVHKSLRDPTSANVSIKNLVNDLDNSVAESAHPFVMVLNSSKNLNKSALLDDLIVAVNSCKQSETENHNFKILGSIVENFLKHPISASLGSNPINFVQLKTDISNALVQNNLLEAIAEYFVFSRGKFNRSLQNQLQNKRRHHEYGGYLPARLFQPYSKAMFPQNIQTEKIVDANCEFLLPNEIKNYKNAIVQMIQQGLDSSQAENTFNTWAGNSNTRIKKINLPNQKYESELVNYFFEALASPRPTGAFLALYNILEAFMVDKQSYKNWISKLPPAKRSKAGKNPRSPSELDMLKAIIRGKVKIRELSEQLKPAKKVSNPCFRGKLNNTVDSFAERIYDIRCALVHSKKRSHKLLPFTKDEFEVVQPHLDAMFSIAVKIIEETKGSIRLVGYWI